MRRAGIAPDLAARVLDEMELLLEEQSPEDAAAARAAARDGLDGEEPEWIGPSAELRGATQ
jgi:hypothetical protein